MHLKLGAQRDHRLQRNDRGIAGKRVIGAAYSYVRRMEAGIAIGRLARDNRFDHNGNAAFDV